MGSNPLSVGSVKSLCHWYDSPKQGKTFLDPLKLMMTVEKNIIEGKKEHLESIYHVIQRAKEMDNSHFPQWPVDNDYPSRKDILEDLVGGGYFIFLDDDINKGSVVMNENEAEQYQELEWKGIKPLAIHRLVVHPQFRQEKIAFQLMQHCIAEARRQGYDSFRLDTYSLNKRANNFYQKLGFEFRGCVNLPFMPEKYNCYELIL
ncbi:GNAT family N-acetyltransferase [Xanthovirga aplysinae]|uniref:GNAT family N-acetyltransferase n=1 Tax=Xanthovirga aplysinae TaxID=2529853 RepID=UPI0012BBD148|nr:GNAT family N-acetyltransferase [Xanthovirga aplysinae]MTI30373.1 GNAT family N-acetyltransferase [Xanthovirga aplysinae]